MWEMEQLTAVLNLATDHQLVCNCRILNWMLVDTEMQLYVRMLLGCHSVQNCYNVSLAMRLYFFDSFQRFVAYNACASETKFHCFFFSDLSKFVYVLMSLQVNVVGTISMCMMVILHIHLCLQLSMDSIQSIKVCN